MTAIQEREMHTLAALLELLTRDTGWEATRYLQIAHVLEELTTYCAVCDCQRVTPESARSPR